MALNAFTAGPTAAQIITQVEAIAGHPGLHLDSSGTEAISNLAYRWLNEILTELYTAYEWPWLETGADITLSARENNLPTDFWRLAFQDSLFIKDGVARYPLMAISSQEFHKRLAGEPSYGQPGLFHIDLNRSTLFVDPVPDRAYACELHYVKYIARLSATSSVPQFPNPELLIQKLLVRYGQHQRDGALVQEAKRECEEMLLRMRASLYGDADSSPPTIPLESRSFRPVTYDW